MPHLCLTSFSNMASTRTLLVWHHPPQGFTYIVLSKMTMPTSETGRYNKLCSSARLGVPIKVTKSQKHCPGITEIFCACQIWCCVLTSMLLIFAMPYDVSKGEIFTLQVDFKTREWSTFHIDDVEANVLLFDQKSMLNTSSRVALPREKPKYQDIIIPVEATIKVQEDAKLPFSTIPIKNCSPLKESKANGAELHKAIDIHTQSLPISSSHSVCSDSVSTQSTKSIFGSHNPIESYSFRGAKLSRNAPASSGHLSHVHSQHKRQPALDADIFSPHCVESKSSLPQCVSTSANPTFTELLTKSSNDISDGNHSDWPAHQIHSRMMGWKLTSPERRQDLLRLLATADLSTASLSDEERRQHIKETGHLQQSRIKHLAKRQAEAYESSVRYVFSAGNLTWTLFIIFPLHYSRLAQHQNKEFKFSKHQLDKLKAKVTKLKSEGNAETFDGVSRPSARTESALHGTCGDPFAHIDVQRAFTAEAAAGLRRRQAQRAQEERKSSCKMSHQSRPDESAGDERLAVAATRQATVQPTLQALPGGTPGFQVVSRNHRDLLNRADRMVSSIQQDIDRHDTWGGFGGATFVTAACGDYRYI